MKEYRLTSWPDLDSSFERMAYRRILSDMSQRYLTLPQLVTMSGLARNDVVQFVTMLDARGLVRQREAARGKLTFGWLRRAFAKTEFAER